MSFLRSGGVGIGLLLALPLGAEPLNLDQAAARVQKKIDGRVLGGREILEEDRPVYLIRVLTPDGRVVHVQVDRETGELLKDPSKETGDR
ncbi:hypothetical protein JCM13664_06810 [Methylothermus subterraneus]